MNDTVSKSSPMMRRSLAQAGTAVPADFLGWQIALIGPVPPPAGGMAGQTQQLGELLQGANAKVLMVPTNPPYWPAWAGRLPVLRAGFRLLPYLLALWRAAGNCDLFHVMANSGWSWHLFSAPAIWIAWLRGTPVIVNYRGGEAQAFLQRSGRWVRWSMRRANGLAVPSRFLEQVFRQFGMAAQIVPNIVDLVRFFPHPRLSDPAAPHLIVTRNLEPLYDIETALRAFALIRRDLPDAILTVAGSGPEEMRLKQTACDLGLDQSVRFVGRLDRDQVAALYRRADLTLNPSLADNMPNSVLESLASGVPVVSTNVGGIPFIVQHEVTALLVAPRDPQAFAHAALKVLRDRPALWSQLSEAGVAEAQRYTWDRVAPVLKALYGRAGVKS